MAVPSGSAGITRHDDLYGHLESFDTTIVAGAISYLTRGDEQEAQSRSATFRTVWTFPYTANDGRRILNWVSFLFTGVIGGLRAGRAAVVVGSSPHLLNGLGGWVVARLQRARFVLEIRDLWPEVLVDSGMMSAGTPVYRVLDRLALFLYRRADAIVAVAQGMKDEIVERGIDADKIVVISNGAEPQPAVDDPTRTQLRAELGLSGTCAVYCGAHGPSNGLDLLLDAALELADTHPEVTVALMGDGMEKARLRARAEDEGLANVRFFDPVSKTELYRLLPAFDIGVHCLADLPLFQRGNSPNKVYDYLASGLPVVTNVGGWVRGTVVDNDLGVGVEPDGLAGGIGALADRGERERRATGERGRRYLEEHLSLSGLRRMLDERLRRLVGRAGTP